MKEINVYTTEGIKKEIVYAVDDFPYSEFIFVDTVKQNGKTSYLNIPAAFDIETTTLGKYGNFDKPIGFMYHWQICIDTYVVFGRYWEDFLKFINNLKEKLMLNAKRRIVLYVHNLSYEFQFIRNFLDISEPFFKEKRKPLKFLANNCIEFRCSYFLTNLSLEKWGEQTKDNIYKKNAGKYNYRIIRTPETLLNEIEESYCYNDVRGLCENLRELMLEDDLARIPLTSTGYVRRECRKAMRSNTENRELFLKTRLTLTQYQLLKKAFIGGYTHCNYRFAGYILENLRTRDITSSYPFQIMYSDRFPIGKFMKVNPKTQEEFYGYIQNYACVMDVTLLNVKMREEVDFPYISLSKCYKITKGYKYDNGKIMEAQALSTCITEIDLEIIKKVYDDNLLIVPKEMYIAERGMLPAELRQCVYKYFYNKTTYKDKDVYFYLKSKNKLNAIFGMMVTDILNRMIKYIDGKYVEDDSKTDSELLDKYYSNYKSFLPYQWGVYVTALARLKLFNSILNTIDTVYVDTDSNKFFDNPANNVYYENENKKILESKDVENITVEYNGKKYTLGLWEEDLPYYKFISYGSKKYAYIEHLKDGKKGKGTFHITVSGMAKEKGRKAIRKIQNFKLGNTWEDVGRTTSWYNDWESPIELEVNGCKFICGSNIAVLDSTYTLGVTTEYFELIEDNTYSITSEKNIEEF